MSNAPNGNPPDSERRSRDPLARSDLSVPTGRLLLKPRTLVAAEATSESPQLRAPRPNVNPVGYQAVKAELHARLLDEFEERNLMVATEDTLAAAVREFVDRVLAVED